MGWMLCQDRGGVLWEPKLWASWFLGGRSGYQGCKVVRERRRVV